MLVLGMACRKLKLLTKSGIDNMKLLVTNIMLPVAIFHALATADYSVETWKLVGIMFVMLVVSFGVGFLLKPLMNGEYRKYLPFMVSVYEGGLMAYPLYTSLCGQENLSQIAVLDIAGLLFGFSIYMGMLGQVENGEKINAKKLCMSAFHTPAFIASVLGILAGLSKVVICLIDSPFGGAYLAVEGILTTSVTAIILIVVGYSMELTKELIRPCLKTILMRVLLQTLMAIGVLWAVHLWIGDNMLLNLAIISYMSAPATFSMQTFLKKEEGSAYVSTTNSMYCMVSILVYIILALTFGYTMIVAETALGRMTRKSPVGAFARFGKNGFLSFGGWINAIIPILIVPYYSVIGGWVIKYLAEYVRGNGAALAADGYFGAFISNGVSTEICFVIFALLTVGIIYAVCETAWSGSPSL